jgi:hypothetical protein
VRADLSAAASEVVARRASWMLVMLMWLLSGGS